MQVTTHQHIVQPTVLLSVDLVWLRIARDNWRSCLIWNIGHRSMKLIGKMVIHIYTCLFEDTVTGCEETQNMSIVPVCLKPCNISWKGNIKCSTLFVSILPHLGVNHSRPWDGSCSQLIRAALNQWKLLSINGNCSQSMEAARNQPVNCFQPKQELFFWDQQTLTSLLLGFQNLSIYAVRPQLYFGW